MLNSLQSPNANLATEITALRVMHSFIEVPYGKETYRFYGSGRWEWARLPGADFVHTQTMYIPVDVLRAVTKKAVVS